MADRRAAPGRRDGDEAARGDWAAVRVHLHDPRHTGVANAWAALEAGAATLDASLGGIGGCPFAPASTGNVATKDLVYLFGRSGVATGLDLDRTIAAPRWLGEWMGRALPGAVGRAGGFPEGEKA